MSQISSREEHVVNLAALSGMLYLVGVTLTAIGVILPYTADGPWAAIAGLRGIGLAVAGLVATVAATACAICGQLRRRLPGRDA